MPAFWKSSAIPSNAWPAPAQRGAVVTPEAEQRGKTPTMISAPTTSTPAIPANTTSARLPRQIQALGYKVSVEEEAA